MSMRSVHRWITVFFGIFMLWIAVTGVLSQVAVLWPEGEPTAEQQAAQQPPAGFVCPEGWRCQPPRSGTGIRSLVGLFHHLHSGEQFGPVGTTISVLSGFALIFFSFSGIWMYVQLFLNRKKRRQTGLFWK